MSENKITQESVINAVMAKHDEMNGWEFPLHVFPKKYQDIARSASSCMGFPLDFIAASMMFAASVAVGNSYAVHVLGTWRECSAMYMAIVGQSGTNKSHPMSFAMSPLLRFDREQYRAFKSAYSEYQQLSALSKKEREELGNGEPLSPPRFRKFIVSDITPEGVAHIHEQNPRGICLYADELKSWINNFNRYSKGSEEQFWLSAFSGKPIIVDRRNVENSISIAKSFISVIGSTQVDLLSDFAKGERSSSGFVDRILFVFPKSLEKRYWSTDELPPHIEGSWSDIMSRLIDIELHLNDNGDPVPTILQYSNDAKARLFEWQRHNTDLTNYELDGQIKGIFSKLEVYAIRFSLALQMIRWACGDNRLEQVDLASVEGGIALAEYFRETALRVQSVIANDIIDNLGAAPKALYEALPDNFTTAEGVKVAELFNFAERTFKRFLTRQNGVLFQRDRRGVYIKIIR
ncbi:MAG: DUF3987 domain-containing protein [Rikenellaceae bacterium]